MKYPCGSNILVSDRLILWDGCTGTVVCSIEDNQYSPEFAKENWAYLKSGVLIDTDAVGLIHYTQPEDSFEFIARSWYEGDELIENGGTKPEN